MNPSPNCASPSFSVIWAANFCSSAISASVSVFLPSHCFGRCSGVTVLFAQTPWKSGWPSAVRGTTHPDLAADAFDAEAGDCAIERAPAARPTDTTRTPNAALRIGPSVQRSLRLLMADRYGVIYLG